jgi:hypothetical protein
MARRQGLRYVGTDPANHWLPDVPATDHNQTDTDTVHALVASGLYERRTVVDEPESDAPETPTELQPEIWPAELPPAPREPYWWLPPNQRPDPEGPAGDELAENATETVTTEPEPTAEPEAERPAEGDE